MTPTPTRAGLAGLALLATSTLTFAAPAEAGALAAIPELPEPASAATPPVDTWPAEHPMTSATIYLGNVEQTIKVLQGFPDQADRQRRLALELLQRGQVFGRMADIQEALAAAQRAVALQADHPASHTVRAKVLMSLHRFPQAAEALKTAAGLGANKAVLAGLQGEWQAAVGRNLEAMPAASGTAPDQGDFLAHVRDAHRHLDRGDLKAAVAAMERAEAVYSDVNPVTVAWINVQTGIAYLRFGHLPQAERYFRVASLRVPNYYLATEHLAETLMLQGKLDEAADLYQRVVAQNDLPEFWAALAEVEKARGDHEAALDAENRAREGFEAALERWPEAFWQHAADFYLSRGDAERAWGLAEKNLTLRRNASSLLLAAETAGEAGRREQACGHWKEASARFSGPEVNDMRETFSHCAARRDESAAEGAAATPSAT